MIKTDLEKLILSLSVSEKKSFRSYCKQHPQEGFYAELFEMYLAQKPDLRANEAFHRKHPEISFDNTSAYLFRVLTDMLTLGRIQQDKWYEQVFSIMKSKLYTERSLPERALKELRKTQRQAEESEDYSLLYLCSRMELSQIARTGFANMDQQELIDFQMKGRNLLQILKQTHEHHSLYELLSHKLLNDGITLADKKEGSLDDLVLNELSIITRSSSHRFESRKLHLLFQAYFFIHKGEYSAALGLFKQLNELIEQNETKQDFPPYDYLDMLSGILSSLQSIGYYQEMEYFTGKMAELATRKYPEHFLNMTQQTLALFEMNQLTGQKLFESAILFNKQNISAGRFNEMAISPEKYMEYLLQVTTAYFHLGSINKANEQIIRALQMGRLHKGLLIVRACRLLQLVLHFELGNHDLISYELRAYKRAFIRNGKSLPFEKWLFEFISTDLKIISYSKQERFVRTITQGLETSCMSPYEKQILSYFDFAGWIRNKLRTSRYTSKALVDY